MAVSNNIIVYLDTQDFNNLSRQNDDFRPVPNDGVWIPKDAADQFAPNQLAQRITTSFKESASEDPRLTRRQKRKLSSRSGLKSVLNETPTKPLKKEDFPGIPVSDEILRRNYIIKYMEGSISRFELSREFTKWITDPEYAIQLWYEYAGKENPLEDIIDKAHQRIESGLRAVFEATEKYREARREAKLRTRELHSLKHQSGLPKEILDSITSRKLPSPPENIEINVKFDDYLGIGRGAHFNHYLNSLVERKFKPSRSDFGDLLHMIYLPDVDLMRCDKRMHNLMKTCANIDSGKLVSSLRDLPGRIEALKMSKCGGKEEGGGDGQERRRLKER